MMTEVLYLMEIWDQQQLLRSSSVIIHLHNDIFAEGGMQILST